MCPRSAPCDLQEVLGVPMPAGMVSQEGTEILILSLSQSTGTFIYAQLVFGCCWIYGEKLLQHSVPSSSGQQAVHVGFVVNAAMQLLRTYSNFNIAYIVLLV